jgi:Two component regulator propeller
MRLVGRSPTKRARSSIGALGTVREITGSGLPDNDLGSLFQDDRGRIWVSTAHGIAYFENGRFIPVSGVARGLVSSIVGDSTGSLWISRAHFEEGPKLQIHELAQRKMGAGIL